MALMNIPDWIIPATIGATFTGLGSAKLWGLSRGMVGGKGQPALNRLCGT